MFIKETKWKSKNGKKSYSSTWLCESVRENGSVKTKYLLKLNGYPDETIEAMKFALKNKEKIKNLNLTENVALKQGKSIGSVYAVMNVAEKLGIKKALGEGHQAQLAMWQIIARMIDQGSRLSATRLHDTYAIAEAVGLEEGFTEDDLYVNLAWLDKHQANIEMDIFKSRYGNSKPSLFLYDVTSSYLEGQDNELAAYGYNRDGKKGKKQIVIGLLTDSNGEPITTEVFKGNTLDPKTFGSQITKLRDRFGCENVTMVGDRGMIKSAQISDLAEAGFNYITAITRPQIETLLKKKVIQYELFDSDVCEIKDGICRYILRRNPIRAAEIAGNRDDKRESMEKWLSERNEYLRLHSRAKVEVALRHGKERLQRLCIDSWLSMEVSADNGRELRLVCDATKLSEESMLDGCYVITTSLDFSTADTIVVHDRYKDLIEVEKAFRMSKTGHLELRPIYVRRATSTRGHVFVVMLSYMIRKYIERAWSDLNITVEEGLKSLGTLCVHEVEFDTGVSLCNIPSPSPLNARLLSNLGVSLPSVLPRNESIVGTRKKLSKTNA